jgi:protein TonB
MNNIQTDNKPTVTAKTDGEKPGTETPKLPMPQQEVAINSIVVESQGMRQLNQQHAAIRVLLRAALEKHYYYPLLARRRGWQGEVLLGFTLDEKGTIVNARVTRSSGYRTLDNAALKSLNKVAAIDLHPAEALDFELPVIYNLYGG